MAEKPLLKKNMRLFGLPYQFNESVDPRVDTLSPTIGRKFAENIVLDAPVISIIPGRPKFLAGESKEKRQTMAQNLLSGASGSFDSIKSSINLILGKDTTDFKYYDFERSYIEYMKYVNILCRTCASFLEIDEKIDGESCQQYDYRKYRWTTEKVHSISGKVTNAAGTAIKNKISTGLKVLTTTKKNTGAAKIAEKYLGIDVGLTDTTVSNDGKSNLLNLGTTANENDDDGVLEELLTNYNFVQFFIDRDMTFNESSTNETSQSMLSSAMDKADSMLKELSFLTNNVGLNDFQANLQEGVDSVKSGIQEAFGLNNSSSTIPNALNNILNLAGNVVRGENIVMPDIYQKSTYSKSYSFTVHLKSPYGTKFGYFMDICVPLMHLLGLALPKQATSNTYGSPFLIKAYCEGIFTCNLGMVTSISISKGVNNAYSADGLPTEVDVSLEIADLYSDLSMTPQNNPTLFINNSSLIEYLATTCGLSLITPMLSKKLDMIVNTVTNSFSDVGNNIISGITEALDNLIMDFAGLEW
jgi:hypothetical protein